MASHARKMTLVPVDDSTEPTTPDFPSEVVIPASQHPTTTTTKRNSIRKYALDRQRKMVRVILKLAQSGSYDMDGSLLRSDGSPVEETDMVSLLLYTMSPGRVVRGLYDFVEILINAGVTAADVINTQVKEMLMKRANERVDRPQRKIKQVTPPHESRKEQDDDVYSQDHDYSLTPPPKLHGPFPRQPSRGEKRKLDENDSSQPASKISKPDQDGSGKIPRPEEDWTGDSEAEFDT